MSYEDLMAQIAREIPELAGKLSAPRVTYVKSSRKTYISFNSTVLAGEKQFLKLEAILREMFPGRPLALRIASPDLKAGFLEDPSSYREVLDDFLRRNYPMARGWIGRIGWQMERNQLTDTPGLAGEENGDGLLTLVFPDEISLQVMRQSDVGIRLATAVYDIFTAKIRVEMTVEGTREERLRRMKEERRDAALTVTAREMAEWYGTGVSIAKEEESAARKPEREKKPAGQRKEQAAKPKGSKAPEETPASPVGKPILGRSIADRPVEIRELTGESGLVVVQGEVFHLEQKELKGGETLLVTFAVTDGTSSVMCKIFFRYRSRFMKKEEAEATPITDEERAAVKEKTDRIRDGMCVRVRGECLYDSYARDLSISVRDLVETEKEEREDTAEEKRVELHMHTNMSTMDALTPVEKLIERAAKWGHPAVAVTDHGVLQSFPSAFRAAKGKIKLIPGCEGYLIDEKPIVENADERPYNGPVIVLDFESTGLNTGKARIIEIGAVKLENGEVTDEFSQLVDPAQPLGPEITELTGISDAMLQGQPRAEEALPKLLEFIGDLPIAAHNAHFDASLLKAELKRLGTEMSMPVLDTLAYARKLYPELKSFRLAALCKHLGVSLKNAHRAVHDAS